MATCAECVHVDVCSKKNLHVAVGMNITPRFKYKRIEQECEHFKNRARFVELPCRIGDKVYELCRQFGDYKIGESEIRGFIVDTSGTAFDYELLGERFFLTREEAEQALKKEREANGQSEN